MNSTTTTTTDRDQNGRFSLGNRGGPGNPYGGRVSRFRKIIMDATTDEDMEAIVAKLIELAKEGSLSAIKLLLGYSVGKPGNFLDAPYYYTPETAAPSAATANLSEAMPMPRSGAAPTADVPDLLNRDFLSPLPNGILDNAREVRIVPEAPSEESHKDPKQQRRKDKRPK